MTPIPEKTPESAELVDVVYALRQRVEQLEETVHDLLTGQDEHEEQCQEQDRRLKIVEHRTYRIGVRLK